MEGNTMAWAIFIHQNPIGGFQTLWFGHGLGSSTEPRQGENFKGQTAQDYA
jgi:hypothetical protein